jgi:hypothetical protein
VLQVQLGVVPQLLALETDHCWSLVSYFHRLTSFSILNVQMGVLFLSWMMTILVSLALVLCPSGRNFQILWRINLSD